MVVRKRRKVNKQRGERTQGNGDTKNNRGSGSRGGTGLANGRKGKFASLWRLREEKHKLKPAQDKKSISLEQLNRVIDTLVGKGKVKKENEFYVVTPKSGYTKILSGGNTELKLLVKINASKNAIKKILSAGGKFEFEKNNFSLDDISDDDEFVVDEVIEEEN
ncbi:MAG: uL15 family ribosomal protein [Candidatus ainarchaeum sp.]|nr:uL15 family ribosomal protein [Candidatus ainarchaeum sp.]